MRVMVCVALALLGTASTDLETRFDNSASKLRNELRLPAENLRGRNADVTAVQTERDAAEQHLQLGLGERGVGAGGAALGTVEAGVDTRDQRRGLDPRRSRMGLKQLPSVSQGSPPDELSRPGDRPALRDHARRRGKAFGEVSVAGAVGDAELELEASGRQP